MIRARETCHALGLPHVTLDLREEFRQAVVQRVRGRLRGRPDAEPVHAMQRSVPIRCSGRRSRSGSAPTTLWTGHYARVVRRNGMHLVARGVDAWKDQSYMLATVDPALLDRVAFPLGSETKAEVRTRGGRSRPCRGAPAREPGGVLPRRRRLSELPARERSRVVAGRHRRRGGNRARASRWPLAVHARTAPWRRRRVATSRSTCCAPTASPTRSWWGRAARSAARHVTACGRLYDSVAEVDAKLRYRSPAVAAGVTPTEDGFDARAPSAGRRGRSGSGGGALRR